MRVISPAVGGGFGSKAGTTLEGIIIPLARKANGRPVKMTYSREDEFVNSLYVKDYMSNETGVNKDGKVVAVKMNCLGWWCLYRIWCKHYESSRLRFDRTYDIPNVYTDSYCVIQPSGWWTLQRVRMSEIHLL